MEATQATFDELGTPLRDVTFVVVDLETTGGSHEVCSITEVGAVKIRGGEIIAEFQSLVRPEHPIPPFIALLTGITDAMVHSAPSIDTVLPLFLDFARGSVLVAHNAGFDVGFLKTAARRLELTWPGFPVVDTVWLARSVVTRDEAPNHKLATLARVFGAGTTPNHRALSDARATVDVFHGLLARVGNLGVGTLEELTTHSSRVSQVQRRKRHLAAHLPSTPGVYIFRDDLGRALYVGTSKNLRARVRTYFTASESRSRMGRMVALACRVDHVPCATVLEAQVREIRLIADLDPRFNKRSRRPQHAAFVVLTDEAFPRLSVVRKPPKDDRPCLGPLSTRDATAVIEALHDTIPIRRCTKRISLRKATAACALADLGKCGAPCDGRETPEQYAAHVFAATESFQTDHSRVWERLTARLENLAEQSRYEEAGTVRDRLLSFIRAAARSQSLRSLTELEQVVFAGPDGHGGWLIHVLRRGRLVAAGVAARGVAPHPVINALIATAEDALDLGGPTPSAWAEETTLLLRWVQTPGVRMVHTSQPWALPTGSAVAKLEWATSFDAATPGAAHRRGYTRPDTLGDPRHTIAS